MAFWGKIIGGIAGFAMGGPAGAMFGATLGHAADTGSLPNMAPSGPAAGAGGREQVFAIAVVVLSAKLAKCDGPVNRAEIDAFKQNFRIPEEAVRDIGRLFDQARDSPDGFEPYADQLGASFADNLGMLEDVLVALFAIARADGPVGKAEGEFLARAARGFGIDERAWDRARGAAPPRVVSDEPDPYEVIGLSPGASDAEIRATWKQLMRENHPDSLAARGVPQEFIASASEKVARINAAWDRIKRERGL
jgi:DnaJ like chaperone protein